MFKFVQRNFLISVLIIIGIFYCADLALAMPEGTLLYRTSGNGKLYGYNTDELLKIHPFEKDKIELNCGHVGIYVGKDDDGIDYVVEAVNNGIQKTPAKYFVNAGAGEKLVGAKMPISVTKKQRKKIVDIAEKLVEKKLQYDFDFRTQKGPGNKQFICVGLTEKLYESADIKDVDDLVYDPANYAIDITPDGYDNNSVYNAKTKDCFADNVEYSKISRRASMGEIVGTNCGKEYQGQRYFFLPHTQFLQPSLKNVQVDILISSDFSGGKIRGLTPASKIIVSWTKNNAVSSAKIAERKVKETGMKIESKIVNIWRESIKSYQNLAQNFYSPPLDGQQAKDDQGIVLPALESSFGLPSTITAEDLSRTFEQDLAPNPKVRDKFKPKQAGSAGKGETSPQPSPSQGEGEKEMGAIVFPPPPAPPSIPPPAPPSIPPPAPPKQEGRFFPMLGVRSVGVARVIDGDTIELTTGEKVRYIGIDTPELGSPGPDDDECLAWVARLRNMQLLGAGELTLIKDPAVDKDKYGRLLRYVYANGIFINRQLVREGLAETFFCKPGWKDCPLTVDKQREQIIMLAADSAKQNKRGLFSEVCQQQIVKEEKPQPIKTIKDEIIPIAPAKQTPNFIFSGGGDTIAPETTIKTHPAKFTNTISVDFSFTATEENCGFLYQLDDNGWQACGSTLCLTNLSEGSHILQVKAKDRYNNIDQTPANFGWTIDTTPSANAILNLFDIDSESNSYTNSQTVKFEITNDTEAVAWLLSEEQNSQPLCSNAAWLEIKLETFQLSSGDGNKRVYIWTKDAIGNVSQQGLFAEIVLDTISPQTTITKQPTNPTNLLAAEFIFTADEQAVF